MESERVRESERERESNNSAQLYSVLFGASFSCEQSIRVARHRVAQELNSALAPKALPVCESCCAQLILVRGEALAPDGFGLFEQGGRTMMLWRNCGTSCGRSRTSSAMSAGNCPEQKDSRHRGTHPADFASSILPAAGFLFESLFRVADPEEPNTTQLPTQLEAVQVVRCRDCLSLSPRAPK